MAQLGSGGRPRRRAVMALCRCRPTAPDHATPEPCTGALSRTTPRPPGCAIDQPCDTVCRHPPPPCGPEVQLGPARTKINKFLTAAHYAPSALGYIRRRRFISRPLLYSGDRGFWIRRCGVDGEFDVPVVRQRKRLERVLAQPCHEVPRGQHVESFR